TSALLGEGAMVVQAGSWALWRLSDIVPFAYLGYAYRDEGRSSILPYRLGALYASSHLWVVGEYRGYRSMSDDSDTNNSLLRAIQLARMNGGSYQFYSLNPSVAEVAAQVGYRFTVYSIYGGVAQTMSGESTANGMTLTLGMIFDGGSTPELE